MHYSKMGELISETFIHSKNESKASVSSNEPKLTLSWQNIADLSGDSADSNVAGDEWLEWLYNSGIEKDSDGKSSFQIMGKGDHWMGVASTSFPLKLRKSVDSILSWQVLIFMI